MQDLLQLEQRKELPIITLVDLEKHDGHGSTPWVCLKGVVYDVSKNKVYDKTGG